MAYLCFGPSMHNTTATHRVTPADYKPAPPGTRDAATKRDDITFRRTFRRMIVLDDEPMFESKRAVGHPKTATQAAVVNRRGTIKSFPGGQRARHGEARMKIRPVAWIMQILLWALFILAVYAVTMKVKKPEIDPNPQSTWEVFPSKGWVIFPIIFLIALSMRTCAAKFAVRGTGGFLRNVCGENEVKDIVQQLRLQRPQLRFNAECYHYEDKGSGDAKHTVKVVTHRARQEYAFTEWEDTTADVEGLDAVNMTKFHLEKKLEFSTPAARSRYVTSYQEFCNQHRMDAHQDFNNIFGLEGFKERLLCVSNDCRSPWMATHAAYVASTMMLMNAPYRAWFDLNTGVVRHTVVKRIN